MGHKILPQEIGQVWLQIQMGHTILPLGYLVFILFRSFQESLHTPKSSFKYRLFSSKWKGVLNLGFKTRKSIGNHPIKIRQVPQQSHLLGIRFHPCGWFYGMPRHRRGFVPAVTKEQDLNPNMGTIGGQKKFLVFDDLINRVIKQLWLIVRVWDLLLFATSSNCRITRNRNPEHPRF